MNYFHKFSIGFKSILLTLLLGLVSWLLLDHYQTRRIATVLNEHITQDLADTVLEDRMLLEKYLQFYDASTTLLLSSERMRDYLSVADQSRSGKGKFVIHSRTPPPWLPGKSVLRTLPLIDYFLLLDRNGEILEVFMPVTEELPVELKNSRQLVSLLNHNNNLFAKLGETAFIINSKTILDHGSLRGYLMSVAKLDNDFLSAVLLGLHNNCYLLLIDNVSGRVIASSSPNIIVKGTTERELRKLYNIMKLAKDVSDMEAHFVSAIPKKNYDFLRESILKTDRINRTVSALSIFACLVFVILLVSRRVSKLTAFVEAFFVNELGRKITPRYLRDQLVLLEKRFQELTLGVIRSKKELEQRVAERTLELEESKKKLEDQVDQRQQSEKALRMMTMLQKAILDSARYLIVSTNWHGIITTFNNAAEELLGYKAGEVIGKETPAIFYAPEEIDQYAEKLGRKMGRTSYSGFRVFVAEVMEAGMDEKEWTCIKKDGERFPMHLSVTAIRDFGGELTGYLWVGQDISKMKAAQKALNEAFELNDKIISEAPIGLALYDHTGQCIAVNKAVSEMVGAPQEVLLQDNYFEIEDWKKYGLLEAAKNCIAKGEKIRQEFEFSTMFGSYIYFDCTFVPFTIGDHTGLLIMLDDISQRKIADFQQKQSLAEKETLLKEIHHRVKNNMQIVASLMYLQAQKTENSEALAILQESQDRLKSMGLVHELLYSRGNLAAVPFQDYLETLVQSLAQSYRTEKTIIAYDIKAPSIELPVDTAIPCGLICNELITNSLKHAFSKEQQGKISIYCEKNGEDLSLSYRDNGVGIPADFDYSTQKTLGLNLIRTLAAQLDASVEFKNENGMECHIFFQMAGNHDKEQK